jgi:hypothetical protein
MDKNTLKTSFGKRVLPGLPMEFSTVALLAVALIMESNLHLFIFYDFNKLC